MTYEHDKADADAPVTWTKDGHYYWARNADKSLIFELRAEDHDDWEIDALCRAFHLAKLAEEMSKIGEASDLHDSPCVSKPCNHLDEAYTNWLRRYRAAKGEA